MSIPQQNNYIVIMYICIAFIYYCTDKIPLQRHWIVCLFVACDSGKFGNECAHTCHCMSQPCNRKTGECPPGECMPGYTSINCSTGMKYPYIISTHFQSVTLNNFGLLIISNISNIDIFYLLQLPMQSVPTTVKVFEFESRSRWGVLDTT